MPSDKYSDTLRCLLLLQISEASPDGEWEKYNADLKTVSEKHLRSISPNDPLTKIYKKYLAYAYNGIGFSFQNNDANTFKALENYRISLQLREEAGDNLGIAESLNNIGGVYQNQGNISKSLEYYHKSLKLSLALKNDYGIANTLNNLGRIYAEQVNFPKALEYYQRSLDKHKEIGNKQGVAVCYNNLANLYYGNGDTLKALEIYGKSAKAQEEIDDKLGRTVLLNNIGIIYENKGNFKKALLCYREALDLSERAGFKKGANLSLYNIGNYYRQTGDYTKALEYGKRSLELSRESGHPQEIFYAAGSLKKIYQAIGNYSLALEMQELSTLMQDSIQRSHTRKENIRKQFQYEFEEKENGLKLKQEAEQEIQKALFRQKQQYTILVFALTLVILASVFTVIYYKNKIRKKKKEQDYELQLKDSEIKALQAQMNPHFIFNSLNSIMEYIRRSEKEEALRYLTKFSKLVRMVLESSNKKTILLSEEIHLLTLYVELENLRFGHGFKYNIDVDPELDIENIEVPALIIQPFIENAILHGLQNKRAMCHEKGELYNPELRVGFNKENALLKCIVEDNGIGRQRATEIKSRKLFKHQSMGMQVTKNRLDLFENTCEVVFTDLMDSNKEPAGTRVEVLIPITEIY